MIKIALVYFSNTDITGQLMRAAHDEIVEMDVDIIDYQINGPEIVEGRFVNPELFESLKTVDAIIFGSPTYMGNVSAQFKAFADASSEFWETQEWSGKIAAGITSGTGLNGDQSSTLQYLSVFASQHGMFWVGIDVPYSVSSVGINRLGCHLGVTSHCLTNDVHEGDLKTARYLARRVVSVAKKLDI